MGANGFGTLTAKAAKAQVAEMRLFGGLELHEIATLMAYEWAQL